MMDTRGFSITPVEHNPFAMQPTASTGFASLGDVRSGMQRYGEVPPEPFDADSVEASLHANGRPVTRDGETFYAAPIPAGLTDEHVGEMSRRGFHAWKDEAGQSKFVWSKPAPPLGGDLDAHAPEDKDALRKHLDLAGGMPAEDFFGHMFGDKTISRHFSRYSHDGLTVSAELPKPDGSWGGGSISRTFRGDGSVDHSYFQVANADQGAGLGKKLLGQQIPLYQRMGMHTVTVHANIDVGGYAWARYGFAPDQGSWDHMRGPDGHLQRRFAQVADQLPPKVRADITKALASKDPKAMWAIADDKSPVRVRVNRGPTATGADVARIASAAPDDASLDDVLGAIRRALTADGPLPEVAGARKDDPGPTTLGKHLLLGANWHGKLDLKDRATMKRFNAYVGSPVLRRQGRQEVGQGSA